MNLNYLANQYNITIKYGKYDDEFCYEARVAEFPDVFEYADSAQEAYELAIDTIETIIKIFKEKGKSLPVPLLMEDNIYSGRITLRLPKSLHKKITEVSIEEDVSLNQCIVSMLAYQVGYTYAQKDKKKNLEITNHSYI